MQAPAAAAGPTQPGGVLHLALGVPGMFSPVALELSLHGGAALRIPIGAHVVTVQIRDAVPEPCMAPENEMETAVLKAPKIRRVIHRGRPMYRIILPVAWCRLLGKKTGASIFAGTKANADEALKRLKLHAEALIAKSAATAQPVAGAAVAVLPAPLPPVQPTGAGTPRQNLGSHVAPAVPAAITTWTAHRRATRGDDSSTQRTEEYQMRKFLKGFKTSSLDQITATVYERWLGGLKELNVNSRIRLTGTVRLLFDFCTREGWVGKNPILDVRLPQRQEDVPEILPIEDVEKLLWAALQSSSPILPGLVLQLFSGYRRKEYLRGAWPVKNLKARFVTVRGAHAKTHKGRQAPLCDASRAWLENMWPDAPRAFAPFKKMSENEEWYQLELAKVRALAGISRWPHNVLRHLYASYHHARFNDFAKLSREMGNTEAQARKYAVLLDEPETQERYWRITPDYLRTKFGGAPQAVPPTPTAPEIGQA